MASKVERELRKATGVKKEEGESQEDYIKRLLTKIADLPEQAWENLSEDKDGPNGAKNWYNSAVDAEREEKPYPPFPSGEPKDDGKDEGGEATEAEADEGEGGEATEDGDKEKDVASKKKSKGDKAKKSKTKDNVVSLDKVKKAKEAKPTKEKKEKKAKDGAAKGERVEAVWDILLKNPKAKPEDVAEKTKMQISTVGLAINRFNRMMKYLDEKGLLKKSLGA